MTEDSNEASAGTAQGSNSVRMGAFSDAVVAIAMTLLILPLMEAVPEAGEGDTMEFLHKNSGRLLAFVTSFVIIASFWLLHHRIFRGSTPSTARLTQVNLLWLLTIVFLPIPTALSGVLHPDRAGLALYIGTLLLSAALLTALAWLEYRTRREVDLTADLRSVTAPLSMTILFGLALVIALIWPQFSYLPMFLLFLTGPLRALLVRVVRDSP